MLAVIFPPRITMCHTKECPPYKNKGNIIFKKREFVEHLWLLTVAPVGSQSKDRAMYITEPKFEIH